MRHKIINGLITVSRSLSKRKVRIRIQAQVAVSIILIKSCINKKYVVTGIIFIK